MNGKGNIVTPDTSPSHLSIVSTLYPPAWCATELQFSGEVATGKWEDCESACLSEENIGLTPPGEKAIMAIIQKAKPGCSSYFSVIILVSWVKVFSHDVSGGLFKVHQFYHFFSNSILQKIFEIESYSLIASH